ncbi:pentapeptide repeat-containing protein [Streptomyces sp. NPDC002519]
MDFTSWADWARALLGATVTYAMTLLIWKMVVKAATFSDPYERTGRHILLVPRRLVRPRMDVVGSQLRASTALRRFQGLPPTSPYLPDLVELDRSTRQLQAGRRIWTRIIPCALVLSSVTLGTWLGLQYMTSGPFSELPSLYHVLDATLGSMGWYDWNGGDCTSWTVLRGCEASAVPWWSGTESGLALGIAAGWLLAAWRLRRVATREFSVWGRQQPPLLECLRALTACRDTLRPSAPGASLLDTRIAELRAALRDFAREGVPADSDRRAELEEHSAQVATALHDATGRVLRDGITALPALIRLLAMLQDRLHASRWLVLLDPSLLSSPPGPGPAPGSATTAPAAESGRWQRYTAIATALPTVPAMLALVFTAVTISQAKDTLKLTERDQVASDYNETVANLGDESANVRTSAIYAIQRIMRDSPRDQPALVEILSSYVRGHAKMPDKKQAERVHKDAKKRLPDDVQAALNVLGSRQLNVDSDPVIDLRNTFLVGANLYGLNFNDADFRGADLTEAYLDSGSFENVWFDDAQMSGSILSDAEFDQATFLNTDLKNASWDGARFEDADLTGADLTGATLSNGESGVSVDLRRAGLAGANLTEADLTGADLRGANLSGAPDQGISAAKLVGTNFTDADLTGALLDGTDRQKATWNGARLP